jgi:hypothetical protein
MSDLGWCLVSWAILIATWVAWPFVAETHSKDGRCVYCELGVD